MMLWLWLAVLPGALAADYFVAPTGLPAGNGSAANPWSLTAAISPLSPAGPGDTVWLRGGVYRGQFNSYAAGDSNAPVTFRGMPGERVTIDGVETNETTFIIYGPHSIYRDFELTNSKTNRAPGIARSAAIYTYADHVKLINLVSHDNGLGVGFWKEAVDSEVYGCLIYNIGWQKTNEGTGHSIYSQNETGTKRICDNIIANAFGFGVNIYTEGGQIRGYNLEGNIVFQSGAWGPQSTVFPNIFVGGFPPASGIRLAGNATFHPLAAFGSDLLLSYGAQTNNEDLVVTDNLMVGGNSVFTAQYYRQVTFTNNTVFGLTENLVNAGPFSQITNLNWDHNRYYGGDSAAFIDGNSAQTFSSWQTNTGADASSFQTNAPPTGAWTLFRTNRYDRKRAHLAIYNWDLLDAVSIGATALLTNGEVFEIRSAQDYYGAPVLRGVFNGGPLSVPMTNLAVQRPVGMNGSPLVATQLFNAFVITAGQVPLWITGLTNQLPCPGTAATFATTISGTGPLVIRWRKNGILVPGETNCLLTVTNAQAAHEGLYTIEVNGPANAMTNSATLALQPNAILNPPGHHTNCPGATVVLAAEAQCASPLGWQWFKNGSPLAGATNATFTIPSLSSNEAGLYCLVATGPWNSTSNFAHVAVAAPLASPALGNQFLCPGTPLVWNAALSGGLAPVSIVWRKDGELLPGATNGTFTLPSVGATNAGLYTVEITDACKSITNSGSLTLLIPTTSGPLADLAVCPGAPASFSTTPGGSGPFQYAWRLNGAPLPGETNSSLHRAAVTGADAGLYTVIVSGACGQATNSATLAVHTATLVAPLTSLVRCPGEAAVFNATPGGTGPFTFQWTLNGTPLSGETNAALTLAAVAHTNAGLYAIAVAGLCNRVTNSATLAVLTNTAATPLTNVILFAGQPAVFSTTPSGTGPFTFRWMFNSAPLAGRTTATLSLPSVTPADDGIYMIEVTGACGSVTNAATLTVTNEQPATLISRWRFDEASGLVASDSVGINPGELVNGPTRVPGKVGPGALAFNGTNQYVQIFTNQTLNVSNNFSFALWIRPSQLINASSGRKDVFVKLLSYWLLWNFPSGDGRLSFLLNGGSPIVKSTTSSWPSNQWQHIACTYDGAAMKIYVNGVLEGTQATTVLPALSTYPLQIGGNGPQNIFFPGSVDDAQLYYTALSSNAVMAIYNSGNVTNAPPATNSPPFIIPPPGQSAVAGVAVGPLPFTIGDVDTNASVLTLSATSSVPALVAHAAITFGGSGSNRTISLTPAAHGTGVVNITIRVADPQGATASASFGITFTNSANRAPSINPPPTLTVQGGATATYANSATDPDLPLDTLTWSLVSSRPVIVETGPGQVQNVGALRQWWARAQSTNSLQVVAMGDSITEGLFASDYNTRSWLALVRAGLQSSLGNGGRGLAPFYRNAGSGLVPYWQLTGAWDSFSNPEYGPFGFARYGSGAGSRAEIDLIGDTAEIYQVLSPFGLASNAVGAATWQVDGGPATPFNSFAPGFTNATLTIALGTNGPHTLRINVPTPSGKSVGLWGAEGRTGATGVRVHNIGRSGTRAGQASNPNARSYLRQLAPDLTLIGFSSNDYSTQTDTNTYRTNVMDLINEAKLGGGSVLLIGGNPRFIGTTALPQSAYHNILRELAYSMDCAFLDMLERWGDTNTQRAFGFSSDNVHPNDFGHADQAGVLLPALLTPPAAAIHPGNGGFTWATVAAPATTTNTFQLRVTDDGLPPMSATQSMTVIALGSNVAPFLPAMPPVTTTVSTATSPLALTVLDPDSPGSNILFGFTVSNTALIPNSGVIFGGSGSNRTVTLYPTLNQTGQCLITIKAYDGLAFSAPLTLAVSVIVPTITNAPPSITNNLVSWWNFDEISGATALDSFGPNPGTLINTPSRVPGRYNNALHFTATNQYVTAAGSPSLNVSPNFSLALWIRPSEFINASSGRKDLLQKLLSYWLIFNFPTNDGRLAFVLNTGSPMVKSTTANWAPEVWRHITATYDGATMRLYVNGNLEGTQSTPAVPAGNANPLLFGGNLANNFWFPGAIDDVRLYSATLSAAEVVSVFQGSATLPPFTNQPPTITAIANQTVPEDGVAGPLAFTIFDPDTPASLLSLTFTSTNLALLPLSSLSLGGSGTNRTLTLTPVTNQFGTSLITIIVTDTNAARATNVFLLTVTPVNDPPTLSTIADQSFPGGIPVGPLAFTIADLESTANALSLSATSSVPALVPDVNIAFGGSAANRTVTLTPSGYNTGMVAIAITVTDPEGAAATRAFTVTFIASSNQPPTITPPPVRTAAPGVLLTQTMTATDPNPGDTFTWSLVQPMADVFPQPGLVQNAGALRHWWSRAQPGNLLNVVGLGDSITEGLIASDLNSKSWLAMLRASLQTSYGAAGGGVAPFYRAVTSSTIRPAWMFSGTWTSLSSPEFGPFGCARYGSGVGVRVEIDLMGDSAEVYLVLNSFGTTNGAPGAATWQVDGGAPVPFNTLATTYTNATLVVPLGTNGPHRLRINAPAGAGRYVGLWGAQGRTATSGVRVHNVGRNGTKAGETSGQNARSFLKSLNPDLTIIGFTSNDYSTQTDTNAYRANLISLVDEAKAAGGSVLLLGANPRLAGPLPTPQADYHAVMREVAYAMDCAYLDMQERWVDASVQRKLGLSNDDVHPSDFGHADQAFAVLAAMTPCPEAAINPATGLLAWTTPRGPATTTNVFQIRVLDSGSPILSNQVPFTVVVSGTNAPPQISPIPAQTLTEDTSSAFIPITLADADTAVGSIALGATASDPQLLPGSRIFFGGSGANRTIVFTPAPDQTGQCAVIIVAYDGMAFTSTSFQLTVNPVNDPPFIAPIPNQTNYTNTVNAEVPFTIRDADTPVESLTLSALSSNPALVPNASLVLGGAGTNRTIRLTPLENQQGTATISIFLSDGFLTATGSFLYTVIPVPTNRFPTITVLSNQTIAEDVRLGPIPVVIGDFETPGALLNLIATSSNPALVPDAALLLGGTGGNRTLTLTPLTNQFGSTIITLTVTDTNAIPASTTNTFLLTVNPVNDAPFASTIPSQTSIVNQATADLPFQIGDVDNPVGALTVTASASNPALISSIVLGGFGGARTVRVIPATDATGSSLIRLTVTDGAAAATNSFLLTVLDPALTNTPPSVTSNLISWWKFDEASGASALDSISNNIGALVNTPARLLGRFGGALQFNGANQYVNTPHHASLSVSNRFSFSFWFRPTANLNAASGRKDLFQKFLSYWLLFNYPANDGKLTFVLNGGSPVLTSTTTSWASNQWHHIACTYDGATMRLYVNSVLENSLATVVNVAANSNPLQFGGNTSQSFWFPGSLDDVRLYTSTLTTGEVTHLFVGTTPGAPPPPTETPPVIADIPNQIIEVGQPSPVVPFLIGDGQTPAALLTLSATSTNTALVPVANVVFGGSASNRNVTVNPAPGLTGNSFITVTVTDTNGSTASDSFLFTVVQSNSPPFLALISDQFTAEDTPLNGVAFTIGDGETPAGGLVVSAVSSNLTLLPNAAITIAGSTSNRTLNLVPAPNQSGSTLVTVTVSDGLASASRSFLLTVTPVNDAPVISAIPGATIYKNQPTADLPFTVGDIDHPAAGLTLTASSSNPTLAPVANISFGGAASNRTVRVTPATNQTGFATITVFVSDGILSASNSFLLTVQEPPPPITTPGISWWKFDEASGTTALDSASNNVGTLVNSPARVTGRFGSALQFNGINQYVNVPGSATLNVSNRFSFAFWFRPSVNFNAATGRKDILKKFLGYWLLFNFPNNDGRLTFVLNSGSPIVQTTTASWPSNQWQHIACTYDGATMRIFVNGVLEGSQATSVNPAANGNPLQIGGNTDQGFWFPGALDEVRLFGGTLTTNEVLALYNSITVTNPPTPGNAPPVISGIANLATLSGQPTPATGFLIGDVETAATNLTLSAASTNTALVPPGNVLFGGSGSNRSVTITPASGLSGTSLITVTVADGSGGSTNTSFLVTVIPGGGGPPSLTNALLGWWKLDESNLVYSAADSSGGGRPGAWRSNGDPFFTPHWAPTNGQVNGAIELDGVDDYLEVGAFPMPASYSKTAWVKPMPQSDPAVNGHNIISGDSRKNGQSHFFHAAGGGADEYLLGAGHNFTFSNVRDTQPMILGTWYHVAVTYEPTNGAMRLFKNGSLVASATGVAQHSDNWVNLGNFGYHPGTDHAQRWRGFLDDARIYGRILTDTEIGILAGTIAPSNALPELSIIPDQVTAEDLPVVAVPFTAFDVETPPANLVLIVASSNPSLLPAASIVLGGSGTNRTLTLTPLPHQFGVSTVTITLFDNGGASTNRSFLLTVNSVNDLPILSALSNRTIERDQNTGDLPVTIGDVETPTASLTLSASSTNAALVPPANITFGGSGSNRTVRVTPAAGQLGSSLITVVVQDSDGGSATSSFLLTVTPPNTPPVIGVIPDQSTPEDSALTGIAFTIGDEFTPAGSLVVSAVSANPALVPNAALTFSGGGSNRTLNIAAPATNQTGTATITVTVSDGQLSTNRAFLLTVTPVNDAPVISAPASSTITKNQSTADLPFTVGDVDHPAASLALIASSSNPTLAPVANITFGGSGSNRTVRVSPATNQTGTATITVVVDDGALSASNSFLLTVQEPPPPVTTNLISWWQFDEASGTTALDSVSNNVGALVNSPARIAGKFGSALQFNGVNQHVNVPSSATLNVSNRFSFAFWFQPTANLNAASGRKDLFKKFLSYWLLFNFPNNDGRLTFVLNSGSPVVQTTTASWPANQWQHVACTYDGATMRIYVNGVLEGSQATSVSPVANASPLQIGGNTDQGFWFPGGMDDVRLFGATLTPSEVLTLFSASGTPPPPPANTPPAISDIPDQLTQQGQATPALAFTIGDAETPATLLTLSVASTNTALVPLPNIVFGGSGSNRTVSVTPAAGISGTSRITVTVTDTNGSTASDSFLLTVIQSNSPPVLSDFIDHITAEETPMSGIAFTIGDSETSAGSLALTAVSSNTTLLPNAAIAFGGSGSNRTLTLTPALNQSGTTLVTITVTDGLAPVSKSFLLTVTPVNDAPVVSAIAGVTISRNQATADLPFIVGDVDNTAATLALSATSSNPTIAPVANISFGGSGSTRTVRVTPATNQIGTTTITVIVSDGSLSASNSFLLTVQEPAPPVAANLISWWKFDEASGSSALDSASNNIGALFNSPVRVAGRVGTGALQFNGVNQYVNVPDASSLDVTTGFSFTIWFKPSVLIGPASGRRDVFKKFLSYWLLWNFPANDGRLAFVLNSGSPVVKSTTASWPANQWQHIACTHDGATMRIYVNGVLEGSQAATIAAVNTAHPLQFGGNTDQGFYFPGCVDDVRLYRAALNATDVLNLFNGTAPSLFPAAVFGPPALSIFVDVEREMVVLSWAAQPDRSYRVEYNDTLGSEEWLPLAEGLRGLDGLATFEEGHLARRQRFYRVVLEP